MSGLPQPQLHKDAKYIFLSDWDGTITDRDSNDFLTDNYGMGVEGRKALNHDVLTGEKNFRDTFREMLGSVKIPFDECKKVLSENITLDPGFKNFYAYLRSQNIPFIIVSSGMQPTIYAVLEALLGDDAKNIEIISNDVKYLDPEQKGTQWEIVWRHPESGFGHDKSRSIEPYRQLDQRPTIFFAGDGVSDLSAARHADLLFTKVGPSGESDLQKFCEREGIPHVDFKDFSSVQQKVQEVVEGGKSTEQVIAESSTLKN